jgi:hypothetical protein
MNPSATSDSENKREGKWSRRDWILLPMVSLLTLALLAVSTESILRWLFPVSQVGFERCFATDDPSGDAPVKANSFCVERTAESKFPVEYRFDSRGHRVGMELEPKQPGTYRIVMIGSSMAMGLFVPQEKSFAGVLPKELSQQIGRRIELYNEATGGKYRGGPYPLPNSVLQFKQVISDSPDMILWIVTPMDIENADPGSHSPVLQTATSGIAAPASEPTHPTNVWSKFWNAVANGTLGDKLHSRWEESRTSVVLKHFLIANESQDQYVTSYLKNEDEAGFLKTQPNLKWLHLLQVFQSDAAKFAQQAKSAGIPFVAVLVPNRAQAAMVSMGQWPQGYDPYKLDDELRAVIQANGGTYIDILSNFRKIPSPERYYFPVDGHLDAEGHAVISGLLTESLTGGAIPALKAVPQPQIALTQGR